MKTILLVVDVQEDFVRGSLPGENALERVPNMLERLKLAEEKGDYLIFTQDSHDKDTYLSTQEGQKLPIYHCVRGTKGHEIYEELQSFIKKSTPVIEKETFASFELAEKVGEKLEEGYEAIEIFGICTDICVINTAVVLKNMYPEVPIYVNASCSAGVSESLHEEALNVMESFHINIIRD